MLAIYNVVVALGLIASLVNPRCDAYRLKRKQGQQQEGDSGGQGAPAPLSQVNEQMNIVDALQTNSSFTILNQVLDITGLRDPLMNGQRQFTVFAPTDAAFARLPEWVRAAYEQRPEAATPIIRAIMLYHIADRQVSTSDFAPANEVPVLQTATTSVQPLVPTATASTITEAVPMVPIATATTTVPAASTSLLPEQVGGGTQLRGQVNSDLANIPIALTTGQNGQLMVNGATVVSQGQAENGMI
ncbi:hypothetical protein HK101_000754, partial [Irineochytrium annulatum]